MSYERRKTHVFEFADLFHSAERYLFIWKKSILSTTRTMSSTESTDVSRLSVPRASETPQSHDCTLWLVDIPVLTLAETDEVIMKSKFSADKLEAKLKALLERGAAGKAPALG